VRAYNFGVSESNLTKLPGDVPRGRRDNVGTTFGRGALNKIWKGKKRLKFVSISDKFRL